MPRVLTSITTPLDDAGRSALLVRCGERRRAAKEVGCNYWVFERPAPEQALVEFFEAGDPDTLERARRATDAWPTDQSILREVEL